MKIDLTQDTLTVDENGVAVTVDLTKYSLTAVQRSALEAARGGRLSTMSQSEKDILKDLKAFIGGGAGPNAGFMRFDFKFVSIN